MNNTGLKSIRFNWNLLHAVFIGLCANALAAAVLGGLWGVPGLVAGIVAGWVARREGWKAGFLLGLAGPILTALFFCFLFLTDAEIAREGIAEMRKEEGDLVLALKSLLDLVLSTAGGYSVDKYRARRAQNDSRAETKCEPQPQADWSAFYGVLAAFLIACFSLNGPLAQWQAVMLGGVVAGTVSRRNGWMAGTVFGLLFFAVAIYTFLSVYKDISIPGTPSYEMIKGFPSPSTSELIGRLMGAVPLAACGGLIGAWLRALFTGYAIKRAP